MKKAKPYIIVFVIIVALICIDQIVKMIVPKDETVLIPGLLKLTFSKNTGGAFSIGSNNLAQIIIINVIILTFAIRFLITKIDKADKITKLTLCLIIAGGISNLLDRIFRGYVIDYINIEDFFKFPIFNIADIFIVVRMDYFRSCNYYIYI